MPPECAVHQVLERFAKYYQALGNSEEAARLRALGQVLMDANPAAKELEECSRCTEAAVALSDQGDHIGAEPLLRRVQATILPLVLTRLLLMSGKLSSQLMQWYGLMWRHSHDACKSVCQIARLRLGQTGLSAYIALAASRMLRVHWLLQWRSCTMYLNKYLLGY
jgi:hypothetical protein